MSFSSLFMYQVVESSVCGRYLSSTNDREDCRDWLCRHRRIILQREIPCRLVATEMCAWFYVGEHRPIRALEDLSLSCYLFNALKFLLLGHASLMRAE